MSGFALSLLFASFLAQSGAPADDLSARFRSEGLARLAELEAACDDMEGEIIRDFSYRTFQARTVEFLIHRSWYRLPYKRDRDLENDEEMLQKGIARAGALGQNSRYSFRLRRKTPSTGFEVSHMGKGGMGFMEGDSALIFSNSVHALWKYHGKPLRVWLSTPGFLVEEVRSVAHEGRTSARLRFTYASTSEASLGIFANHSGELWLDPERHWSIWKTLSIARYRTAPGQSPPAYTHNQRERVVVEYGPSIDNLPMPRVVSVVDSFVYPASEGKAPYVQKETHSVTKLARRHAEEHEFTLSSFGIPEVLEGVPTAPKVSLWVWLILLGLLAAVLAVAFRWKAAKMAVTKRSPN